MKSQKQLLDWIRQMLEENIIPGFRWHNREEQIFQLPWPHGSASHWKAESTVVFSEWAKFKGKLQGREKNYKQLKATFRCAMNSRKELVEIKELKTKKLRFWKIVSVDEKSSSESKAFKAEVKQTSPVNATKQKKQPKEVPRTLQSDEEMEIDNTTSLYPESQIYPEVLQTYSTLPSFDAFQQQLPPSPPQENMLQNNFLAETATFPDVLQSYTSMSPSFDTFYEQFPPSPPLENAKATFVDTAMIPQQIQEINNSIPLTSYTLLEQQNPWSDWETNVFEESADLRGIEYLLCFNDIENKI